jgi:Transglutaminase-like superfamily
MFRLTRFLHLPAADRWMALEALVCLGLARAAVLTLPFRWVACFFGRPVEQNSAFAGGPALQLPIPEARAVAQAIARVKRHTPWHSNCLAQAVAGLVMLRRRGISGTLYFGMARNSQGALEAHAWLRSGGAILTGGRGLNRFAVVAAFAAPRVELS